MIIFLLFTVVLGLAGVVGMTVGGALDLNAVPNLPVAGSVIGILVALYFATLLSHRGERGLAFWPTLAACLSGAVLVMGAFNKNIPGSLADYLTFVRPANTDTTLARNGSASVRLRRNDEGGFFANSEVNGVALTARIDSGAATIILKQSDAEKAGIDVASLSYDTPLRTANGTSYLAPTRLKSVRVGSIVLNDVEALVARPGSLSENLLGTSFLRRLASYEVAGNFATLRQ